MDNLFLLLSFVSIICFIAGLIKPSIFSRFIKGSITRKKIALIFGSCIIVFFILFGMSSNNSGEKTNNTAPTTKNTETTPTLAQHKVIPEDVHGTTRIIHVIIQTNITKDELIAINNDLIKTYSNGLTHLNIEYFDDEVIASDYFQKVSQVSETEADKLFTHYMGTYKMNKTTGHNKLNFNENGNWTTIKEY